MKKNHTHIRLHISEPCAEKWENMQPQQGGRHCDACSRTIVDFSTYTDAALARYYQKNSGKICGRFRLDQLDHPITLPTEPSQWERWRAAGLVASGLLLSQGAMAQEVPVPSPSTVINHLAVSESTIVRGNSNTKPLTGTVTDALGEPLIGAHVRVVGTYFATATDIEGHYELDLSVLPNSFAILVTYLGYQDQTVTVDPGHAGVQNFSLEAATQMLDEVVVVGSKPTIRTVVMGGMMASFVQKEDQVQSSTRQQAPEISEPETPMVLLYPNPFISTFQLSWETQYEGKWTVKVLNADGRLLLQQAYVSTGSHQQLVVDAGALNLPAGTYFLYLESEEGELHTLQVMKGK